MYLVLILTRAPKIGDSLSRAAWSGVIFGLGLAMAAGAFAFA